MIRRLPFQWHLSVTTAYSDGFVQDFHLIPYSPLMGHHIIRKY